MKPEDHENELETSHVGVEALNNRLKDRLVVERWESGGMNGGRDGENRSDDSLRGGRRKKGDSWSAAAAPLWCGERPPRTVTLLTHTHSVHTHQPATELTYAEGCITTNISHVILVHS